MFGLFKKKTVEEKYGRDNYLIDPSAYVSEKNWILALSAVYLEFTDISASEDGVQHDRLEGYEQALSSFSFGIVETDLDIKSKSKLKKRLKKLRKCWPENIELDLYDAISADSREAVKKIADDDYSDDEDRQELLLFFWDERESYGNGFHYRLASLIKNMWEVRMLACQGKLTNEQAWEYLYELTALVKPLLTLFDSWDAFLENQRLFMKIENQGMDIAGTMKDFGRAITCLLNVPVSPLKQMPYDFGIDKNYPYNLKSHSYQMVKQVKIDDTPKMQEFAALLAQEDKQPLWDKFDGLSKEDNYYFIPKVIEDCNSNNFAEEDVIELPELYPNVHYAYMLRGTYYNALAWDARGCGTADTVGDENYRLFFERMGFAANDFQKAYELVPTDPNVWCDLASSLFHLHSDEAQEKFQYFCRLIQAEALDHSGCTRTIASFKERRWGGSHKEGIDWSKTVIEGTKRGSVSRLIPFIVALERYDYIRCFDDDDDKADAIFQDKVLVNELNEYFDELLEVMPKDMFRISSYLSYWYRECGDIERLRAVGRTMTPGHYSTGHWDDYSDKKVTWIMNWIRSI